MRCKVLRQRCWGRHGAEEIWALRATDTACKKRPGCVIACISVKENECTIACDGLRPAHHAGDEVIPGHLEERWRYDDNRPFATWLLSIAAHYCIDQLRRKNPAVKSIDEMVVPDIPDPAPDMDTRLSRKQEQQRVRAVLETLEPIDRAAVVMYYWYDYSYDEICQELGLTLSAVKSRLHRARKALADRWSELQAGPVTIEGREV